MSDAHDILTSRETFETDVDLGADTVTIEVKEPTLGELDAIEAEMPDDAEEIDLARRMVDEYLVEPDLAGDELGLTKALAVYSAMQTAFQSSDAIENAREAMPLEEGNR